METIKPAPLFIKVSRYKQTLDTIDYLKSEITTIKNSLAALRELREVEEDTKKIVQDVFEKVGEDIRHLDSELLRPTGFKLQEGISKFEPKGVPVGAKEKITPPVTEIQEEQTPALAEEKKIEKAPEVQEQLPLLPTELPKEEVPFQAFEEALPKLTEPEEKIPVELTEEKKYVAKETFVSPAKIVKGSKKEKGKIFVRPVEKAKKPKIKKILAKEKELPKPKVKPAEETKPENLEIETEALETAKTLKVSETEVKEAIQKISELERKIPEKVTDVRQVEELKQMISQLEGSITKERLIIIPQLVDRLITTRERISQLEFSTGAQRPSRASALKRKMAELELKKQQLTEAKEIVKKKYYEGEIDEDTLRNIVQSYEEKIVEAEVELKHAKKELEKKGKEPEPLEEMIPPQPIAEPVIMVQPQTPEIKPVIVKQPGVPLTRPIKLPTTEFPEKDGTSFRKSILPSLPKIGESPEEVRKIKTDLDKIVQIVNENGSVSIGEIAKLLGLKENQVEEWGTILEDHELLKLHYPPIGKPVLRKIK